MSNDADLIRATERARLASLIRGDIDEAIRYHAPDFQLVTPKGIALTRDEYFGEIASGSLRYIEWIPSEISVRAFAGSAAVRYRARLEIESEGTRLPSFECWHTDTYERLEGLWVVVWSQATRIA
jgi:hypothetical protein